MRVCVCVISFLCEVVGLSEVSGVRGDELSCRVVFPWCVGVRTRFVGFLLELGPIFCRGKVENEEEEEPNVRFAAMNPASNLVCTCLFIPSVPCHSTPT